MTQRDTAEDAPPSPARRIAELVFLGNATTPVRVAAGAAGLIVAVLAALGLEGMHRSLAAAAPGGLNPLTEIIASGSSAATVWPGWLAAAFFAAAVLRLRHGPAEPPPGRGDTTTMSVSELRAGVRAEYRGVRIALVGVGGLALIDIARAAVTALNAGRDGTPAGTVAATIAEALGLLAAALVLAVWAWSFRDEMERWGALTD